MATLPSVRLAAVPLFAIVVGCAFVWWLLRAPDDPAPPPPPSAHANPANTDSGAAEPATASTADPGGPGDGMHASGRTAATTPPPTPPAVAAAGAARTPPAATVRGRVVDPGHRGIAGAKVAAIEGTEAPPAFGLPKAITERRGEPVTTEADGAFALPLDRLGAFELVATHDEHPEVRTTGNASGPSVEGVLLVMPAGGTIAGTVVGAPADAGAMQVVGKRVPGTLEATSQAATAVLFDFGDMLGDLGVSPGSRQAAVASDGTFVLRGLDPGSAYEVFATRTAPGAMPVRCTQRAEVRTGVNGVVLRWRVTTTIVARVVDADTGAPLEDLVVGFGPVQEMKVFGMSMPVPMRRQLPERHFVGGVVRIDGVGVDDGDRRKLSLEVAAVGRRTWSRDDLEAAGSGGLDLGTIRLAAAPTLRVVVRDRNGPVAGATVRAVPKLRDEGGASTDKPGIRFSTTVRSETQAEGDTETAAKTVVEPGGTESRVATDADGVAMVTAQQAGPYVVVVESVTHARWQSPLLEVPERGTTEVDASLVAGGTARVHVRDGHGKALAGAEVQRTAADDDDVDTAKTDPDGSVTFERLTPGQHTFALQRPGRTAGVNVDLGGTARRARDAVVQVPDGGTVEVELQAPLRGSLRGTVTLDGAPLERAQVRLVPATPGGDRAAEAMSELVDSVLGGLGADGSATRTDADGAYTFDDVDAGPSRLTITHKDLAMPAAQALEVVEGENRHDVDLRTTTLRGRVLRLDGSPVQGAAVTVTSGGDATAALAADLDEAASVLGELFGGGASTTTKTDADGAFELRGVRAGEVLRVQASERLSVTASVEVPAVASGTLRDGVEVRLAPGGRLRVKVATGSPFAAVALTWAGPSPAPAGATRRTAVLKRGRATIDGMVPGPWRAQLEAEEGAGGTAPERAVTVVAGQTTDVDF